MKRLFSLLIVIGGMLFSVVSAKEVLVKDQADFNKAFAEIGPGDVIVLADGVWRDFEMLVEADGTAEQPIIVRAQTLGKVILSGQSNLRIAGEYLIVSGLVFKDGYTPTNTVVSFRRTKGKVANNSRVTQIVIDNYNNPERYEVDFWVMMYGKNNRFDHNHLVGKKNKGVTMAVRLDSKESQENNHRIDHNYFGPRPVLGSNGGETLRIGTSKYSLTNSNTLVEKNFFDRCDGELEIISVKSGNNVVRNNTFYESKGTLTLRHGNDNKLIENVFFGGGVDHTGGIRVINKNQTVTNNYMEGLTGYRFGGALVVMNGVHNSPINRYHQVDGAVIANNTIVNSDHIQLAAGSDEERAATPINSSYKNNLMWRKSGGELFTVYDDVSGVKMVGNVMHDVESPVLADGIQYRPFKMNRAENGLLYPDDAVLASKGVSRDLVITQKEQTGVEWYPKSEPVVGFQTGETINVEPGEDTLTEALKDAKPGDTLQLKRGVYHVTRTLPIKNTITIKGKPKRRLPIIEFSRTALFDISAYGRLQLENLHMTGRRAPDNVGNALIRTSKYSMLENYHLEIIKSKITDLNVNRAFDVLQVSKSTMADNILIKDTNVRDVSGAVLKLTRETDDFGIFNADYVTIAGSKFENIGEEVVNLYRGGRDESTFGPHLMMRDNTFINVGRGSRNKSGASVRLHGVQLSNIEDTEFVDSAKILVEHTVSEPVTKILNNKFERTEAPQVLELVSPEENTATLSGNIVK